MCNVIILNSLIKANKRIDKVTDRMNENYDLHSEATDERDACRSLTVRVRPLSCPAVIPLRL